MNNELYLINKGDNNIELMMKTTLNNEDGIMEYFYKINLKIDEEDNVSNVDINDINDPIKYILNNFDVDSEHFHNKLESVKLQKEAKEHVLNIINPYFKNYIDNSNNYLEQKDTLRRYLNK